MRERELIDWIAAELRSDAARLVQGPGDDASVVRGGPLAVTSVDTLVEDVHFRLSTHSHEDVGHKALAAALSDLAAMGAPAGEALVALGAPPGMHRESAHELLRGLRELADRTDTALAGGDVVSAPVLIVSVTVNGWVEGEDELVFRGGATAGELVAASGALGGASAGLALLEGADARLDESVQAALLARHRRPEPRLELGRRLAAAGVSAMIDLSDGVAADAGHVAARSGVELAIRLDRLPLAGGVAEVAAAAGRDAPELAATGGDDYELLVTLPPGRWDAARSAAEVSGTELTVIGETRPGSGVRLLDENGQPINLRGYEHGVG